MSKRILLAFLLILSPLLMCNGCSYKAQTNVGATNLVTPYGTAKDININRNAEVNVR